MQLSKTALPRIAPEQVIKPPDTVFELPEKVLQFGTGVLLRALPDYFIDKANRAGIFIGRIVVVKSTDAGDTHAFAEQDGLYTLCIRGIVEGSSREENIICSGISRVLSAKEAWHEVLQCAQNPALNIIISNTTEVGLQLVPESIFQQPPASFPAKLLAFLYERFKKLGAGASKLVVLPTELITDNGKILRAIVTELARFNNLEAAFVAWLDEKVSFCSTLVDCIVPGRPEPGLLQQLEERLGYTDALLTVSEVYRLWAIEGDAEIKSLLPFAAADDRVIITPDITRYKELKLRLLNATHTLSCGLAFLAGIPIVRDGMEHPLFSKYISNLMLHEIAPAIPVAIPEGEAAAFGKQVLDRFRNPYLQHQWLSITMQYSSKMAQRVVPVLRHYVERFNTVPQQIALGFAAYLLFSKPVTSENGQYRGMYNGNVYPIKDDQAHFYEALWRQHSAEAVVPAALRNEALWGTDLTRLVGFAEAVQEKLEALMKQGVLATVQTTTEA
jgi:tagaturonate reductase